MRATLLIGLLLIALSGCSKEEPSAAEVPAQPGIEVQTQTTTETVTVPAASATP